MKRKQHKNRIVFNKRVFVPQFPADFEYVSMHNNESRAEPLDDCEVQELINTVMENKRQKYSWAMTGNTVVVRDGEDIIVCKNYFLYTACPQCSSNTCNH